MMVSLTRIFIVCLLTLSPSLFAKSVTFKSSFQHEPILYNDMLFGLTQDNAYSKLNLSGQSVWRLPLDDSKIHLSELHFNRLFVADEQGRLHVFDAEYGYRLWRKNALGVQTFKLGYPWVYYLDEAGYMGSLDFFTGQELWTHTKQAFKAIIPIGKGTYVGGLTTSHLHLLSTVSGKRLHRVKLPKTNLKPLTNWNRGLALTDGESIFVFQVATLTFKKSEQPIRAFSQLVNQKFYLSVSLLGEVSSYDLETSHLLWTQSLEQPVTDVVFSQDALAIKTEDDTVVVLNQFTGEQNGEPLKWSSDSPFSYLSFFEVDKVLYFMSKTSLFKLNTISAKERP